MKDLAGNTTWGDFKKIPGGAAATIRVRENSGP